MPSPQKQNFEVVGLVAGTTIGLVPAVVKSQGSVPSYVPTLRGKVPVDQRLDNTIHLLYYLYAVNKCSRNKLPHPIVIYPVIASFSFY